MAEAPEEMHSGNALSCQICTQVDGTAASPPQLVLVCRGTPWSRAPGVISVGAGALGQPPGAHPPLCSWVLPHLGY